MADLTPAQRQMMVEGLNQIIRQQPIDGSAQILPQTFNPYPGRLPPAVERAIAPYRGIYSGQKGDFVTGVNPPASNEPDPRMMNIAPPTGDQTFERQDMPWWNSEQSLRRT
jgi:hypothetical protein